MYSVFSNYFEPLLEANVIRTKPTKSSEIYDQLRIAYNQGVEGILNCTRLVVSNSEDDEINDELLYTIWKNVDLQKLVQWINKNITLKIGIDDYRTINVKLRISAGMLNKIMNNGVNPKLCAEFHYNLSSNVQNELSILNTEDLPF